MLGKAHTKKLHGSPLFCGFPTASVFEESKSSSPSNNPNITSLLRADSNERYGRRDHIRTFGNEENNDESVFERLVKLANNIEMTKSKKDITMCHRLPSRNP